MEIDFREIDPKLRYKLLISTVIPRPIALVSTRGPEGIDNVAPFSFFRSSSSEPDLSLGEGIGDLSLGEGIGDL